MKGLTKKEKVRYLKLLKEKAKRKAAKELFHFTNYTMPTFEAEEFHKVYLEVLNRFANGYIKKLIITMPPQHGKSEQSTRRLPAYLLGVNPDLKIAIASYNDTFAKKFNRDVQRIIDSESYHEVFPNTTLNNSNVVTVSSNFLRNANEFEIVGYTGSLKAVGRGGALTGNPVDIMVMDDLYKDYAEGNSPVIREAVWDWYTTVVKTRLHNDSQELIVFTRWHEDDLIGRIEKKETVKTVNTFKELDEINPDHWVKINFEALKESEPTELDPRKKGEALWPSKHNKKKLNDAKDLDAERFNCLYQGNPISAEGRLYNNFQHYDALPQLKIRKAYIDTADSGNDYLCCIVYGVGLDEKIYILDILYTDEPMEQTEQYTPDILVRNSVNVCDIESNNGGRGFARVIDKSTPSSIVINWFHQSQNKESRIYSNSASVQQNILFPKDWHIRFPLFYEHLTGFKKNFKANKYDDCADAITGVIEKTLSLNEFFVI